MAAWDDADVQQLARVRAGRDHERLRRQDRARPPPSAADISVVVVARDDDGTPLGCGALRDLGDDVAELKRMYVVPAARRRGVSRAVLGRARGRRALPGWTTLRLETGPRQTEAIALYDSGGYRRSRRPAPTSAIRGHSLPVLRAGAARLTGHRAPRHDLGPARPGLAGVRPCTGPRTGRPCTPRISRLRPEGP